MGGGGGGGESGEPEFQIAPMIDVLLTLLIFFMSITSAQVLRVDKDIKLPVAVSAKKKDEKNAPNELALNIRYENNKGVVTFEDKKYPQAEDLVPIITQRFESRKAAGAKLRVIIRGDKRLPAVEVQKVMTVIAQTGVDDISFSAVNK